MKTLQKKTLATLTPYVVGVLLFYFITLIYFLPLIQGKRINQSDILHFNGAAKEIIDYRARKGEEALWTNSMFAGMPAYQISIKYSPTVITYLQKILRAGLPNPASSVFIYFVGFFMLLLVLRVNPWLAIVGALAFGFSSYNFIIIEAGHNTKALAIAYMAPVFAGVILAYRDKSLWGYILTSVFLGLEIKANHYQITYYLLMIVIIYGLFELIHAIKNKALSSFVKTTSLLFVSVIIALMLNLPGLWSTYEYSKLTIRGQSELSSANTEKKSSGLDTDYITQWSYGIEETLSLLIPNAKGGATGRLLDNPHALKEVDARWKQNVGNLNHYWGNQPSTSGPVYLGAIILFMFIFGLFVIKGRLKWVLLVATILSIMLAWGKNFLPLTNLFINSVPFYNKFRAVTMILVIAEFCIPLLALITINKIIKTPGILKTNQKQIYLTAGITGGLIIILYLFPQSLLSFLSNQEVSQFNQLKQTNDANAINQIIDNLIATRIYIFRADALRSLFYIAAFFILLFAFGRKVIKTKSFILILGILVLFDMTSICRRYLNSDKYIRKTSFEKPFNATLANNEILKDKSIYRVLNVAGNTYMETSTSYYHHSIGGYTAAKLGRYQDLIEHRIEPERILLVRLLTNRSTINSSIMDVFRNLPVLNMLNAKYLILNPNQKPIVNTAALGNAWFVQNYYTVNDANEEIASLRTIKTDKEAVFDVKFKEYVEDKTIAYDSLARIKLTSYKPNHLIYQSSSNTNQFAVFSEIHYDKGWNVYVDGEKADYFRANYVLRAMIVPAGDHKIEFRFEPKSVFVGNLVASIFSYLVIIIALVLLAFNLKKNK